MKHGIALSFPTENSNSNNNLILIRSQSLLNTHGVQWKVITGKQLRIRCIYRMLKAWRRGGPVVR